MVPRVLNVVGTLSRTLEFTSVCIRSWLRDPGLTQPALGVPSGLIHGWKFVNAASCAASGSGFPPASSGGTTLRLSANTTRAPGNGASPALNAHRHFLLTGSTMWLTIGVPPV